jgi:transposase
MFMQGNKQYQEKLFLSFRLPERVPEQNFYRRLKDVLDFSFLRKQTAKYYGKEGQSSIDPEVFFKLMLIGYIENLCSDRKIIEHASMRMDMLYFLNYNIDEPLPWHSTLSRTRKLYGKDLFLEVFQQVLHLCIKAGMVNGSTHAVDSAFIKANAAIGSLTEKQIRDKSSCFYHELSENEGMDMNQNKPPQKIKYRERENKKYMSKSDPDARISTKPNKQRALNYLGQISVDTASHVICGAMADFADKRDSQCLSEIVDQTINNLKNNNLKIDEILADTNYSSGSALKYLEKEGIKGYIPCIGNYLPYREGFIYNVQEDFYQCKAGVKIPFKTLHIDKRDNSQIKMYYSSVNDCKNCSFKIDCIRNAKYKQIGDSIDKPYYDRMYTRLKGRNGQKMKNLRSSTVEPVLGTLLHFRGMKKVYTKGIDLANKHVLLAATAYNIKKLLAFKVKIATNNVAILSLNFNLCYLIAFVENQISSLLKKQKKLLHTLFKLRLANQFLFCRCATDTICDLKESGTWRAF